MVARVIAMAPWPIQSPDVLTPQGVSFKACHAPSWLPYAVRGLLPCVSGRTTAQYLPLRLWTSGFGPESVA